ncbi:hypothetical protein ACO3UB_06320 [Methanocaldococcus sp. 16A]
MMKELLDLLEDLRNKCARYQDELNEKFDAEDDIRAGCFGMIYNHATQTQELLNFYYNIWCNPQIFGLKVPETPDELERVRRENGERVFMATRSILFIPTMSSIEFCAKEAIKNENHPLNGWYNNRIASGKLIYLSGIIKETYNKKLITQDEKEKWDCLIDLRNIIVHNNGIADRNKKCRITNDLEIIFEEGKMTQGKLDTFIKSTNLAVDLYYNWIIKCCK